MLNQLLEASQDVVTERMTLGSVERQLRTLNGEILKLVVLLERCGCLWLCGWRLLGLLGVGGRLGVVLG
jgi:hypothetical protein